jgi:uncharacterized protein YdhG (YjbR/CyaY superfamily)
MKPTQNISVDTYIGAFPSDVQKILYNIRNIILEAAPQVSECISYGMPAYKLYGKPLVYFAGYGKHIGLYATPAGHTAFAKELSMYKQGKGSVQFPLTQEIPYDLIERMVRYRVEVLTAEYAGKKKK